MEQDTYELMRDLSALLNPINADIMRAEERFVANAVNIPVSIVIVKKDKDKDKPSTKFGFRYLEGKWKLAITDDEGEWKPFKQAPLKMRVRAWKQLPKLLNAVNGTIIRMTRLLKSYLEKPDGSEIDATDTGVSESDES